MAAPGAVDAHQYLAPDPSRGEQRQLAQGLLDHHQVISGGVRPGVAWPQQHC
jgi:hypothetical protein